jgi:hypothetical protein
MEQPFYVGQEVVCIKDGRFLCKAGCFYTIAGVQQCECGRWYVFVMGYNDRKPGVPFDCDSCNNKAEGMLGLHRCRSELFAPLPPAYENISAELAKDAVPETSDIILKPIPVTN